MIEAAADVLVLCSDLEPLGTCVLETMSLELPVIVSDSGGACELVQDGDSGLVVPGSNPAALAQAIVSIAQDQQWAADLGRRAREQVLNGFTLDHHASQVASILLRAAGLRR